MMGSVSVRVMETENTLCDQQCVCESYGNRKYFI